MSGDGSHLAAVRAVLEAIGAPDGSVPELVDVAGRRRAYSVDLTGGAR